MANEPGDNEEGLRLIRAFFLKIRNPGARRIVLAIAEAAARGATVQVDDEGASAGSGVNLHSSFRSHEARVRTLRFLALVARRVI
jgi:hypothetical protein